MAKESEIDVKIGKYRLTADDIQFIVSQKKTHRSGKLKGQTVEVDFTYHSTLISATKNIMKRKVLASKVSTMKELVAVINEQNKLMQTWFDMSIKAGVKINRKKEKTPKKEPGISITKVKRTKVTKQ